MNRFMMKRAVLTITSLFLLGLFSTLSFASTQGKMNWLLIISAQKGKIEQSHQKWTLTLKKLNPDVIAFTQQPYYRFTKFNVKDLANDWKSWFKSSAPNAGFVHADIKANERGVVQPIPVELGSPTYKNGKLIFPIKPLNKQPMSAQKLEDVYVFVDDVPMGGMLGFGS